MSYEKLDTITFVSYEHRTMEKSKESRNPVCFKIKNEKLEHMD